MHKDINSLLKEQLRALENSRFFLFGRAGEFTHSPAYDHKKLTRT
jgi:hypothetical protein